MPTGACGINCDVCQLNLLGLCTTCGAGRSPEAQIKLDTQERLLGSTCPVLSCVVMNQKNYCIRDCSQFPCENYQTNPYPFSEPFIQMQKRRRAKPFLQMDPWGEKIHVSNELWQSILKRDLNLLGSYTHTIADDQNNIVFQFLNQTLTLDLANRQITSQSGDKIDNPMLELVVLSYFNTVDRLFPMGKDLISSKDMKQAIYFEGRNRLKARPLLDRFSDNLKDFINSAQSLGGELLDFADCSAVLYPFPRVPVYYLFWQPQDDDAARCSILFDRSIEAVLSPPMIWSLVSLLNAYLITH